MILGVGTDLCDIRRIERSIERFGDAFLARIFTDAERARAASYAQPAAALAKRFAAKEACAKALGTGLGAGAGWREIGVENAESGRPNVVLTGSARATLDGLTPSGYEARIDVSLSDEPPLASAFVIISARPTA